MILEAVGPRHFPLVSFTSAVQMFLIAGSFEKTCILTLQASTTHLAGTLNTFSEHMEVARKQKSGSKSVLQMT